MSVIYHAEQTDYQVVNRDDITALIAQIINDYNYLLDNVNVIITTDSYLLEINQTYLNHDYYTDIITFDYCQDNYIAGDLFISIDRVKENANAFNISEEVELERVIIHGILHLVGLDDGNTEGKKQMRIMEEKYLKMLRDV